MDIPLFTEYGLNYLFRWGHMLFGVVWIGLLYYFNFVQAEYFTVSYTHLTLPTILRV